MKKNFTGFTVNILQLNYSVAQTWEVLTYSDRCKIYKVLHQNDLADRRISRVAAILFKFRLRPILSLFVFFFGGAELMPGVLDVVSSFLEKPKGVKNYFPFVRLGGWLGFFGSKYFAPVGNGIGGLSYWEWVRAEEAYLEYFTKQDISCLARLAAILYRPLLGIKLRSSAKNGDNRLAFDDYKWTYDVEKFKKVDAGFLYGIFDFYGRSRKVLISQFDIIFPEVDEVAKPVNRESSVITWFNVLDTLAESKLTAYDEINKMPVFTVFMNLSRRIQENERVKKELEKSRK
jgi:hypothetical protein